MMRPHLARANWDAGETLREGWFHGWIVVGDKIKAIIEVDEGFVYQVALDDVRFLDDPKTGDRRESKEESGESDS